MQSQVIICDQQTVYALGTATLVKAHPAYLNPEIITGLSQLNQMLLTQHPKVLVLDSALFDFASPVFMKHIQGIQKTMPIMVVLNEQDNLMLFQLIDNEFTVIVSREASQEEWLKGLEMAKQHKVYFSNQVALRVASLTESMDDIHLIDKVNGLAMYDKYILIRICQEASSKQIAIELKHSKRTIEGHRTKLMQLFEVKNVAGLVKIACISKLYTHYLSNPGLYDLRLCAKTSSL
ncbi:MAG: hypothetical protein RLZ56_1340 [Bacteroidota bacterium]|jgi:DNA-binding NarL/FixJ family response regulator